jgi:hypothetical protein
MSQNEISEKRYLTFKLFRNARHSYQDDFYWYECQHDRAGSLRYKQTPKWAARSRRHFGDDQICGLVSSANACDTAAKAQGALRAGTVRSFEYSLRRRSGLGERRRTRAAEPADA